MVMLGALLLVGMAVWMILHPILAGREAPQSGSGEEPTEAQFRKRVSLLQLRDAEYEYAMGKLGDEDFEALRREISAEALAAIRAEKAHPDAGEEGTDPLSDEELEKEIAEVRIRLGQRAFCSDCGQGNPPGSRFCAECGAPLSAPEPTEAT